MEIKNNKKYTIFTIELDTTNTNINLELEFHKEYNEIIKYVEIYNPKIVIINMENVEFLTSVLLGKLFKLNNLLKEKNIQLIYVNLMFYIKKLFDTSGARYFLTYYETLNEAINSLE